MYILWIEISILYVWDIAEIRHSPMHILANTGLIVKWLTIRPKGSNMPTPKVAATTALTPSSQRRQRRRIFPPRDQSAKTWMRAICVDLISAARRSLIVRSPVCMPIDTQRPGPSPLMQSTNNQQNQINNDSRKCWQARNNSARRRLCLSQQSLTHKLIDWLVEHKTFLVLIWVSNRFL